MKKFILFLCCFLCMLTTSQTGNLYAHSIGTTKKIIWNDTVIPSQDTVNKIDSLEIYKAGLKIKNKFLIGIASFYSKNLEGSLTSTGEKFHHHQFTAASNNLSLGTWVRVTNLKNNKSIVVRINDRMNKRMQQKGRVIDLSISGAKQLNFIRQGLTEVRVEVIDTLQSVCEDGRAMIETIDSLQQEKDSSLAELSD